MDKSYKMLSDNIFDEPYVSNWADEVEQEDEKQELRKMKRKRNKRTLKIEEVSNLPGFVAKIPIKVSDGGFELRIRNRNEPNRNVWQEHPGHIKDVLEGKSVSTNGMIEVFTEEINNNIPLTIHHDDEKPVVRNSVNKERNGVYGSFRSSRETSPKSSLLKYKPRKINGDIMKANVLNHLKDRTDIKLDRISNEDEKNVELKKNIKLKHKGINTEPDDKLVKQVQTISDDYVWVELAPSKQISHYYNLDYLFVLFLFWAFGIGTGYLFLL